MSDDRTIRRLLQVVSVALTALIPATFPLWTPDHPWPQIPWIAAARHLPFWWDWLALGVLAAGTSLQFDRKARYTARAAGIQAVGLGAALLVDQHRLQPWAYEYLLVTAMLALAPNCRGLRCVRWLVVSIYVHSALSKFDAAYLETNGRQMLEALLHSAGFDMVGWNRAGPRPAALVFPAMELLLAIALALPRMRRIGLSWSIGMHALLIWTLGPFGLRHEPGVLIWNAMFIAQNVLLFSERRVPGVPPLPAVRLDSQMSSNAGREAGGERSACGSSNRIGSTPSNPASIRNRAVVATTLAAVTLPLLEPFGCWDHWPSWAVYSSRPAIVTMLVDDSAVADLPVSLQPYVGPPEPLASWRPVSLDQWSLTQLHCPVYPQERFRIAAAAAVAERAGLGDDVLLRVQSPPDRFTGRRATVELRGIAAIRGRCPEYWIPARPRE